MDSPIQGAPIGPESFLMFGMVRGTGEAPGEDAGLTGKVICAR
jgi:hypothetical protein